MRVRTVRTVVLVLMCAAVGAERGGAEDKAAAVLSATRKALGGTKLESLKTFSVESTVRRDVGTMQLTADIEILLDLPDRYLRSELSTGMMNSTMTTGFTGNRPIRPANSVSLAGGGMLIRMGPGGPMAAVEKLGPEDQEKADAQLVRGSRADISRLMLGWFAMTHPALSVAYSYAGEAESPDGKAHVIDAKTADGFAARLFVDQDSSLPLMVTYRAPQPTVVVQGGRRRPGEPPGGAGQTRRELAEEDRRTIRERAEQHLETLPSQVQLADFTLYFEDWREVDGLLFPHTIRRAMNGATNEEWTVRKVRLNPRIDPKKFDG